MRKINLRNIIPVLGIVFFYACSPKNIQKVQSVSDSISKQEAKQEAEYVAKMLKFHNKLNVDSLLNSYNSRINIEEDLIIPLDTMMDEDSSRVVVIGKFINEKDVFALDIYGTWSKQKIDFYRFDGSWQKLKSDTYDEDVINFSFENFNNDKDSEILLLGGANMNGNRLNSIYKYDSNNNQFVKACSLFATELSYDSISNLLHYQYFGSWYMDEIQAIYKWNNKRIIPVKEVRKSLKIQKLSNVGNFNSNTLISYYENPTQDKDTLVLKFKKTYNEKNKKLYDLWENFFEDK